MSSKEDDGKYDGKYDGKESDVNEYKDNYKPIPPQINVLSIDIEPSAEWTEISSPLDLHICFELDRDAVAAYWVVQFLVDSSHQRIIKILGQTDVDDYPEGESEMNFRASEIDVSGIAPSTLTNYGLLMAVLMVDGEEIASVNMVRRVTLNE